MSRMKMQTQIGAWMNSTVLSNIDKMRLLLLSQLYLELSENDINTLCEFIDQKYRKTSNTIKQLVSQEETKNKKDWKIVKLKAMDIDIAKKGKGFTRHTPYINFICK